MCDLLVDFAVETGTVSGNTSQNPEPVTCEGGRVIVAASARHTGSSVTAVAVELAEGALSDSANVWPVQSGTVAYWLTTARLATL